ncbi:chloroplast protein FOR GROWTH AND FERTILITY 2-like [Phragmites australis]|uniref:chloroplast protein FOR GROWTH AND FERTILITY 2-like n=1 Tax=Phragmites australis TaxID=29695 RepID=UPI002D7842F8|nr:chloroplast protein FOR GROWTH AND FERTILITY 2-like [Phragmites australis]
MERLISTPASSPSPPQTRIRLPGGSLFLPSRRLPAAGGGVAPWARLHWQPPRPGAIALASPLRHEGLSAAPEDARKEVAAAPATVGHPWKLLGSLLPKASTAALFLLMTLITSSLHSSIPHPAYASVQPVAKTGGRLLTTELLSSGWAGFFAGCLHTLSGPDHLVALAPLSIGRSRLESGLVGALWGCGHDAGQVIFGLLFLLLKDRLHIEVFRAWGTRVVGLTLLIIGGMGIREASEVQESSLVLEGVDGSITGGGEPSQAPSAPRKKKVGLATFATGIVHGLQPDALLMVLPALALPSRLAGAAFLGMFLVGTVFSMGSYTAFVGSCSEALKEKVPRITEKLTWAASLVAVGMGLALLVGQFFGFSLY